MSDDYKKQLKNLLNNLFQFDVADLDFGIYRIMNKKRDEIEQFIENDLIDAVEAEFGEYSESKQVNLGQEFEVIKVEIQEKLGGDALDENGKIKPIFVTTPFAKELAERYTKMQADMKNADMSDQHEGEIFSHIYQFFSRYYDNGDFMSLRRYSQKEKYAIPYNGEEVVLHWANKDQYYIKTGENFKNYSFKVGEYTVEFLIREAEGTTNNNKAEKRFFVLAPSGENMEYDDSNKKLNIFFEYRGLSKDEDKEYGTRNVQEAILTKVKDEIASQVEDSGLKTSLTKVVSKSKDTEKSLIEKHLRTYTKKNTTDYFIHKDLKGFLVGELDFYIKNEVFHLDDLGTENELSVEQYVTRAKVMKKICLNVIDFLAQIEDFQKMLFEKKKFVVKSDYCMTLDNVPEEMYSEIVKNQNQLNEWNILYGIGEEKQSTLASFENDGINEAYLKENPYLVIDTKFFDQEFKDRLLSSFDDIDESVGGLMMNSENWQALNLMQEKYHEKVKCIYIDPPYNTGSDGFVYKDGYSHSSWLSFLYDRLSISKNLLLDNQGIFLSSIDKNEMFGYKYILDQIFGDNLFINAIVNVNNPKGRSDQKHLPTAHDNILFYAADDALTYGWPPEEKVIKRYNKTENDGTKYREIDLRKTGDNDLREDRPNMFYFFYYNKNTDEFYPSTEELEMNGFERIKPLRADGKEGRWRWGIDTSIANISRLIPKFMPSRKVWTVSEKDILTDDERVMPTSVWGEKQFNSERATEQFLDLGFDKDDFPRPKPIGLISSIIKHATKSGDVIIDFYAGSGTTAHSLLCVNKEDNTKHKYILVEMGDYFDTIMKPRIQKVMYSDNWKDGKPQSTDGISHIFKYQSLEQYEDTLNNIEFTESGTVQRTLADMDGYFLRYMLDFETQDSSPCKFNVEKLTKPFDYTLKIAHGNELKDENVDLVETFNYLLGIHVKQIQTFNNSGTYYKFVLGKKDGDEIAIIWRDTEQLDLKGDKTFIEETILGEFKPIKTYINSDFYVEGAHPIEPEFKKLMVV